MSGSVFTLQNYLSLSPTKETNRVRPTYYRVVIITGNMKNTRGLMRVKLVYIIESKGRSFVRSLILGNFW